MDVGTQCFMMLLGFAAVGIIGIVLAIYLIIRLGTLALQYFGIIHKSKTAVENSRVKAILELKAAGGIGKHALFNYIEEASRAGHPEADIAAALQKRGWPDREVSEAVSAYREILAKYPLPEKGLSA